MITCRKDILPNGLRVVAVDMPHLHSVEAAVYLKAGGRNDPSGKAGISHFLEHMLFRGTERHPTSLELETAFEEIGGSANAATDAETTSYYTRVHPDHVQDGLALLASMILTPRLEGMEIEKKIVIEEALEDLNEQGEEVNVDNLASRLLWPDHPLGLPTIGSLEAIESFSATDVSDHLGRFYVPGNAVVAVAGNLAGCDVRAAASAAFSGWSGGATPEMVPFVGRQDQPRSLFVKDSDSQTDLQVAFRAFSVNDPRVGPLRFIRRILCGGGTSRLHMALREKMGIVYSVDAAMAGFADTGAFSVELSTAPENLPRAVEEILRQVEILAAEEVPAAEFERIRAGYLYDLDYTLDSTYEMQVRYGWGEIMGVARDIADDRAEALAITPAVVRDVAAGLFRRENLNVVAVGPWTARQRSQVEKLVHR